MSEIRFYNYEFEPLCIETEIISLYKTVYYNKIGIFEARVSPFSKAFFKILSEPYVLAENDGICYVITSKQAGENCIIYGRTLNWFLTKRVEPPFTSKRLYEDGLITAQTPEKIVRHLISKHFSENEGNFVLGKGASEVMQVDFRRLVVNPLSDIVIDCLDIQKLGHEVYYDKSKKEWYFNFLEGKELDLTVGEAQRNCTYCEYIDNSLNYANSGVYIKSFEDMGSWDASANNPSLLEYSTDSFGKRYYVSKGGTQFGITFSKGEYAVYKRSDGKIGVADSDEGYPSVISDEKTGLYRWYAPLSARTEETAKNELESKKWEKSIEAETALLKRGTDYSLGDIVKVQKKIGDTFTTYKKRIIGTEYRMENGVKSEKIIFGEV